MEAVAEVKHVPQPLAGKPDRDPRPNERDEKIRNHLLRHHDDAHAEQHDDHEQRNGRFADLGARLDELQTRYLTAETIGDEHRMLADALFHFFKKKAPVLRLFFSDHGRTGFPIRLKEVFMEKVLSNLKQHAGFHADLAVPLEDFASFVTSAFLGLVEKWIKDGLDKTPEQMTGIYLEIMAFIQRQQILPEG